MAINAYAQYQENNVQTAGPGRLLLMAYDGAIRFTRQAAEKMESGDLYWQNEYTKRAQAVLLELTATLDPKPNPQLAANLANIYEYLIRRLTDGNVGTDPEAFPEVILHLTDLRGAWAQVISGQNAQSGVGV